MTIIYGVDTTKIVTPTDVLRAIENCFVQAHSQQTNLGVGGDNLIDENYCQEIVKKAFRETEGDYENPTKESLIKVVDYLGNFSSSLREKEMIENNTKEINNLIELIK